MNVVVLLSGGMDSVTTFYQALQEHTVVAALSFNYGSKHNHREIPMAVYHCQAHGIRHEIIVMDFVNRLFRSDLLQSGGDVPEGHYEASNMKQTVVPFRNGIMLSIAAGFAESIDAQAVVIGAHTGDHTIYPDCREGFMQSMGHAIRLGTDAGVQVLRPFIAMNKAQIAKRGYDLGVDFSRTWTCYKGREIHCGKCSSCSERREAFIDAGVPDPTAYEYTGPLPSKPAT